MIGNVGTDIRSARDNPSGQNAAGEQPMGDVIADVILEATKPSDFGGAAAAFMNSGGVRAGLLYDQISGGEQPGQVTYSEAFTVFNNPASATGDVAPAAWRRSVGAAPPRRGTSAGRDGLAEAERLQDAVEIELCESAGEVSDPQLVQEILQLRR